MKTKDKIDGKIHHLERKLGSFLTRDGKAPEAFTFIAVALLLLSAIVPFIPSTTGSTDGSYIGDCLTVTYHSYNNNGSAPNADRKYNDNTGYVTTEVTYYGSYASSEYNPQFWSSDTSIGGSSILPHGINTWYTVNEYKTGKTIVFTGWADSKGTIYAPGELIPTDVTDLYATWGYIQNYRSASNNNLSSNWSSGSEYTNILDLGGKSFSFNGTYPGNCTIRNGTMNIGSNQVLFNYNIILDGITLIGSRGGSNHGDGNNGLFACGHTMILGSRIVGSPNGAVPADFPQIYGGSTGTVPNGTELIVHSGTYSNIIGGNCYGTFKGDTKTIIKDVTILDTLIGSCSKRDMGGDAYVYATALNMPGDSYEERELGTNDIPGSVFLNESTILTGGSNNNSVKNTYVYITGTSKVWDVQAGGRRADSTVTGTASVEVSGKALVKHALCGSITDGNYNKGDKACVNDAALSVKDSAMVAGVFGAGYDTFYNATYVSMMGGTVKVTLDGNCTAGYVYGGGYRGTIGTSTNPMESVEIDIRGGTVLGDVFGGGRGGLDKICHKNDGKYDWSESYKDSTGFSIIYTKSLSITIGKDAVVRGSVYGGGESVPKVTAYNSVSDMSGRSLNGDVGVASVIITNGGTASITINGTVGGSVFGAGKGADMNDTYNGFHSSAFIIAMDGNGNISRIYWVSGSLYISYDHEKISNYASLTGNVNVTIDGGSVGGSVYGAGSIGKVYGEDSTIKVDLKDASVVGSVFGAGKGSESDEDAGKVTVSSITIKMESGSVGGSVYGGGELAKTTTSNGIVIQILDGKINANVFGGGLGSTGSTSTWSKRKITFTGGLVVGSVYGSSSLGDDGTVTSTYDGEIVINGTAKVGGSVYGGGFKGTSYGNTSVDISGQSIVYYSVYGGADVGEVDIENPVFDKVLVYGSSNITVNGKDGAKIYRSIFGSGNSCKVSGSMTVSISDLKASDMESIQNVTVLSIATSDIGLGGRADATSAQASTKFSINNIGDLRLIGGSTLDLKASVGDIGEYHSLSSDGHATIPANPMNTVKPSGGHIFKVISGTTYGTVEGYTRLYIDVSDAYHGAFAYGSKDSEGGFSILVDGSYRLADVTEFEDPSCRCWFISGAITYNLTVVADGKTDSTGSHLKTEITEIPVLNHESYIVFTGYTLEVIRTGAFELVSAPTGDPEDYVLSMDGIDSHFGSNADGITLVSGLESISPAQLFKYAMHSGGELPRVQFILNPPQDLLYTGEVATVTVHLWEAVEATSVDQLVTTLEDDESDGSLTGSNFIPKNRIDIKIDIYSEATNFPIEDYYDVTISIRSGYGQTRFVINRSFYGYNVKVSGILNGSGFTDVDVAPHLNTEGTLGWETPLGSSKSLSSLSVGDSIGNLTGSFSAMLLFTYSADPSATIPQGTMQLILELDNGNPGDTKHIRLNISVKPLESHAVTFVNMDEGLNQYVTTVVSVYHGETIANSQKPQTWDHFVNWYSDQYHNNVFDFSKPITKNTNVYALYSYTATFDYGDGTSSKVYVDIGEDGTGRVSAPSQPTRSNYTFLRWTDADGNTRFVDGAETISSDVTYYSEWKGDIVIIRMVASTSLEYNATVEFGSTYDNLIMTSDGKIYNGIDSVTALVKTIITTEKFVRWYYVDAKGNNIGVYGDTTVESLGTATNPHILLAEFTNQAINVILDATTPPDYGKGKEYDYGGGTETVSIEAPREMIVFQEDSKYTFTPGNAYFKGYVLDHWEYQIGDEERPRTVKASASVTLTATDVENIKTYNEVGEKTLTLIPKWTHISYNLHMEEPIGGTISMYRAVKVGDGYTMGDELRDGSKLYHGDKILLVYTEGGGYTLKSWAFNGSAEFLTSAETSPCVLMMEGDCSVYTKLGGMYEAVVKLIINGYENDEQRIRLSSISDDRHYAMSNTGNGEYTVNARYGTYTIQIDDDGTWLDIGRMTVDGSGDYVTVILYTVTIIDDSGKISCPIFAQAGDRIVATLPEGYTFKVDSRTPSDLVLESTASSFSFTMPTDQVKVRVTVSPIVFTLEYKSDGQAYATETVGYFDNYPSIADPTKDGYTFGGWFVDGKDSMKAEAGSPLLVKDNQTLIAKWIVNGDAAYTVRTFLMDLNGSTYTLSQSKTESGRIGTKVTATFSEIEGFDRNVKASMTTGVVLEDGSLYLDLYYDRQLYNVIVQVHYGSTYEPSQTSLYFGSPTPVVSLKNGYFLEGLYTSYSDGVFSGKVATIPATDDPAKNIILHANAQSIVYTIAYNPVHGSVPDGSPTEYTISETGIQLPSLTYEGYVFNGWRGIGTGTVTSIPAGTYGNLSLTADWSKCPEMEVNDPSGGGNVTVDGAQHIGKFPLPSLENEVTLVYNGPYEVFKWVLNGELKDPTAPNQLKTTVSVDTTVSVYLKLKGDCSVPDVIDVVLSFALDRTENPAGDYSSGPITSLIGKEFSVSLEGNGFTDGSVSCTGDGVVSLKGLKDATGSIRIFFIVGEVGSQYIVHLTVNIVSDIVSAQTEGSS